MHFFKDEKMSQFTHFCGNILGKKAAAWKSEDFWDSGDTAFILRLF